MLNLLEPYDLKSMGPQSAEALHLQIEAKKLAYEDRAKFYADPDFGKVPVAALISKPYAARRRAEISPERANSHPAAGEPMQADTIYMTVVDRDFNCVSLIQSNFHGFGSYHVPGDLGFALQNRGCLFRSTRTIANRLEPRKRPFHTIIPGFVTKEGKPWLSFGLMGGDMQAQGHVQVLCNMIDFGMDVQEAGDAPRFRHFGSSEPTGPAGRGRRHGRLESGSAPTSAGARGQRAPPRRGPPAASADTRRSGSTSSSGVLIGGSDPRKDGARWGIDVPRCGFDSRRECELYRGGPVSRSGLTSPTTVHLRDRTELKRWTQPTAISPATYGAKPMLAANSWRRSRLRRLRTRGRANETSGPSSAVRGRLPDGSRHVASIARHVMLPSSINGRVRLPADCPGTLEPSKIGG